MGAKCEAHSGPELDAEEWLKQNTFFCESLRAMITPEQCQRNQKRGGGWDSLFGKEAIPPCQSCTQNREVKMQCAECRESKHPTDFRKLKSGKRSVFCEECEANMEENKEENKEEDEMLMRCLRCGGDKPVSHFQKLPGGGISFCLACTEGEEPKQEPQSTSGLEDCEIYTPGIVFRKKHKQDYVTFWKDGSMQLAVDLSKQVSQHSLAVVGYENERHVLKVQLTNQNSPYTLKLQNKDQRNGRKLVIHGSGFVRKWALDVKQKRFAASYDSETEMITVDLNQELKE